MSLNESNFRNVYVMLATNGLGLAEGGVLEALQPSKYTKVFKKHQC